MGFIMILFILIYYYNLWIKKIIYFNSFYQRNKKKEGIIFKDKYKIIILQMIVGLFCLMIFMILQNQFSKTLNLP